MRPYVLLPNGAIVLPSGAPILKAELLASDVAVAHLMPHVETFQLDANDHVKVLIQYSCHCWTCGWDKATAEWQDTCFMDHMKPRAFDPVRLGASLKLADLMRQLPANRIYVTSSDRNYGCYNATLSDLDGHFYTAYFTVKPDSGRFDGIRHKFRLTVESAYPRAQQEPGMKTNFRAVIGKAREGKMVKYRR